MNKYYNIFILLAIFFYFRFVLYVGENMNIRNTIIPLQQTSQLKRNDLNFKFNTSTKTNLTFKGEVSPILIALDKSINDVINSKKLDIGTKLKFHKILNNALPEIMKPKNFINNGRESKVYRINDNYVAKIRRGVYGNEAIRFYNITTCPDKRFASLDFYYGEPVIKLGDVEILKNATPKKDFIHSGTLYKGMNCAGLSEITNYEKTVFPVIKSLPQKSYDDFAKGLNDLNGITVYHKFKKMYLMPDIINPNNLIIADQKIKLVDEFDKTPIVKPNSIYTMLEPLLYRLSPVTYVPENPELFKPRQEIFKKCLIASEKAELPLENRAASPYADYLINVLTGKNIDSIISDLDCKRIQGMSLKDRLNYIEKSFSEI